MPVDSTTGHSDLEARLRLRERQIAALHRTAEALFTHLSVDQLIRETLILALDVLHAEAGSLMMYLPEEDALEFSHVVGPTSAQLTGYRISADQGIAGHVFRNGVADLTHDVQASPIFHPGVDACTGYTTRSMMTVPLKRVGGEPMGVIQILNPVLSDGPQGGKHFTPSDLEVLEVMAAQAAAAIEYGRLAEQARKAAIIEMLGDVSHDIKNMLTPIETGRLTLEPVLDEVFEAASELEAGEDSLPELLSAIRHLRAAIGLIFPMVGDATGRVRAHAQDIANAIKGEIAPPVFEEADLNETVRDVAASLDTVARHGGVELVLELDAALPHFVFDRHQMYSALYNLVNNALPETPRGGRVTVRTCADGDQARVEVEDTGHGIPERIRQTLFTDRCVSTKRGGSGLGTRIVAGVVRRHRGTIEVTSEEGRGTCFRITLPLPC